MVVHVGEKAEQAIRPADLGAQEAAIARVSAELLETPFSRRSPGCEIGRSTACEHPFNTWGDALTGGQSATWSVALFRGLARRRGRS